MYKLIGLSVLGCICYSAAGINILKNCEEIVLENQPIYSKGVHNENIKQCELFSMMACRFDKFALA